MKNLTKHFLILLSIISVQQICFAQQNILVFNHPVTLDAPLVKKEFATGYPLSVGASHIWNCVARGVSTANLNELLAATRITALQQVTLPGSPVFGAFFTTQFNADTLKIIQSYTHGFCFGMYSDTVLTLYYYEVNQAGFFDEVKNITTRINTLSEDLFLSLHYAHFSPGTFPDNSTIFSFICDTLGKVGYADPSDVSVALSKDHKRQAGLFALGMADSHILDGIGKPNGGEVHCENPCAEATLNTHCLEVTDMTGTRRSCEPCIGSCAAGATSRRAMDEHIDLGVEFKYKMMRDFRDQFMTKYCQGRKYIGFYYTFSKYAKLNISMLWKYASVLPDLYTAMGNFTDGTTDHIIVTTALKEKVLEILEDHRDVGDDYFQSILREVAADLETFEGMERSKVMGLMATYGNCTGTRLSNPTEDGSSSYFTTVFNNPSKDEIVVNYFVSGNRIKFELFNSASLLVSTFHNSLARQKFSIPTADLKQGVYLYRISSDEGYEKVGKVAVIK